LAHAVVIPELARRGIGVAVVRSLVDERPH
jgi:hypothetical protein